MEKVSRSLFITSQIHNNADISPKEVQNEIIWIIFLVESKCVQPGSCPEPAEVFWDVGDCEDPSGWFPRPQNF